MKKVIIALIVLMLGLIGSVVYMNSKSTPETNSTTNNKVEEKKIETKVDVPEEKNPIATIDVEGYGKMTFELFPMQAPQSVYNFIDLANQGFYDGLTFHRIQKDFVVQGGDPDGTGAGGPGYSIIGEFDNNGYKTGLTHKKGSIAMARAQDYDSAGSQFYINTVENSSLDGDYAVFGYMKSGEDVLDKLNTVKVTDGTTTPAKDIVIKSIKVDTKGIDYPTADKIENK